MALPRWPSYFIFLWLIPLVHAYTVFETNCSVPVTLSNYVSSPNTRGTLDILWSSLFTIFACTWSVQHPNVPEQRNVDKETSRGWIRDQLRNAKWGLKSFYRSTLRMLSTVIAPELIIATACSELLEARNNSKQMQEYASKDGVIWSLTHSYYANMGGFVVRNPLADKTIYHDPYHLTGHEIFKLREEGHITKLPNITEAEIKDKSKGDMLGKLIALGQIVWSTIQIITRAVRKLPVSPLEVAVVAFAFCAVVIYLLYLEKPQRIGVTQTIQLNDNAALYNKDTQEEKDPRAMRKLFRGALRIFGISLNRPLLGVPISMDRPNSDGHDNVIVAVVVSISAALFGGIHAVAWNFAFPSTVELTFWRCASIYTAASPIGVMLIMILFIILKEYNKHALVPLATPLLLPILSILLMVIYPFARLFVVVEMFRTLCFLPPGSYIST